jgi:hypothetical protein
MHKNNLQLVHLQWETSDLGYRQLYRGTVEAITQCGRIMIPRGEADRLLCSAGCAVTGCGSELRSIAVGVSRPGRHDVSNQAFNARVKLATSRVNLPKLK